VLKKISAIFLFFVMVLCGSSFYVAWYFSLQSIRDSQRALIANAGFNNDRIIKFIFSKSDLKTNPDLVFDDDEREFEFKQKMYDVINQKSIGDSIYFSCISDNDEDNLNDMFIAQILETGINPTGKQLPIFKFRLDHFTSETKNSTILFRTNDNMKTKYKTCNVINLPSPYLAISSPPPKITEV